MPSEDSLAEPVSTTHFTACGSLTRTLDSGIGTFPPPDHSSSGTPSKNLPKTKSLRLDPPPGAPPARPPGLTKVPRRAHTLEREVPGIEELLIPVKTQALPHLSSWPRTGPSPTPEQLAAPATPSCAHPDNWRDCLEPPWPCP